MHGVRVCLHAPASWLMGACAHRAMRGRFVAAREHTYNELSSSAAAAASTVWRGYRVCREQYYVYSITCTSLDNIIIRLRRRLPRPCTGVPVRIYIYIRVCTLRSVISPLIDDLWSHNVEHIRLYYNICVFVSASTRSYCINTPAKRNQSSSSPFYFSFRSYDICTYLLQYA